MRCEPPVRTIAVRLIPGVDDDTFIQITDGEMIKGLVVGVTKTDVNHTTQKHTSALPQPMEDTFVLKYFNTKHMEVTKTPKADPHVFNEAEFDRNFKPKGAIAFFVLMVILGLIIWYGIYFLMLARA